MPGLILIRPALESMNKADAAEVGCEDHDRPSQLAGPGDLYPVRELVHHNDSDQSQADEQQAERQDRGREEHLQ